MRETNISAVKDVALSFLHIEITETEHAPIVVSHPIFESGIVMLPKSKNMANILQDEDALSEVMEMYESHIRNADSVNTIFNIIRNPYKLAFVKYVQSDLSLEDFSKLLADAWVLSENPNQDINVSLSQLASMFKKADKKYLMDESEYKVYDALPSVFSVYRGVAPGRNQKGMSWTRNKSTAEWFANRFNIGDEKGYIQKATARKQDVLAYFNSRDEDEIVISTNSLKNIHII